jgi:hypothetical protein
MRIFLLMAQYSGMWSKFAFTCPSGTQNQFYVTTVSDASTGIGQLTVNGVTYQDIFFNDGAAIRPSSFLALQTDFFEVTGAGEYGVPFQMIGHIQAALTVGGPGLPLLLDTPVSGTGVAEFVMVPDSQGGFFVLRTKANRVHVRAGTRKWAIGSWGLTSCVGPQPPRRQEETPQNVKSI